MMNPTNLDQQLKNLYRTERKITAEIISVIQEIDRRKCYLELGYDSLFAYLTKGIGYSAPSAQRRIEAARLTKNMSDIHEKIKKGSINLTTLSMAAQAIRQKEKTVKLSIEDKKALVSKIENQTTEQTQLTVAQELDIPVLRFERKKIQQDESLRVELTLIKEDLILFNEIKKYISHAEPNPTWAELFRYLGQFFADKKGLFDKQGAKSNKFDQVNGESEIQHKFNQVNGESEIQHKFNQVSDNHKFNQVNDNGKNISKPNQNSEAIKPPKSTSVTEVTTGQKQTRYISAAVKRNVYLRDRCCQWKHDGKKCGSQFQLQFDHIQPIWAGGSNNEENLQLLCRAHNAFKYRKEASITHV